MIETDVTERSSAALMAQQALDRWGRIDVLVNNSGIAGPSAPLWEVPADAWDDTITGADLNVSAGLVMY